MANASFHAKITADARQFIQQVEQANQALQELTKSTEESQSGKTAKSVESKKRKEQKVTHQEAEQALNRLHQEEMQNIKRENQTRLQGIKKAREADRLQGPVRQDIVGPNGESSNQQAFKDQAKLITGAQRLTAEKRAQAEQEKLIQRARRVNASIEKSQLRESVKKSKSQQKLEQKRVALQKKLVAERKLAFGPLRKEESTTEGLLESQRERNQLIKEQKAAATAIASQNRAQSEAMITGRYALYDMANAYRGVLDVASRVTKELVMTIEKAADFETAFTSVERAATLEKGSQEFNEIREALIDLSREIPVAFDEISEIATLGAQMGIVTEDLADFTETVAQFSAVTGNSIDDTAEKFGRLSALANVPTEEFENLASSVVFAGFNAVATEKEILKMSESIVAAAANSGYAGEQVVGLATALASLGVQPERARGAIQELFSEMNRAVEGTSDKITNFADIMGLTESAAKDLFKSDPEAFFTEFMSGLEGVENLTVKLDEFGFTNRRTVDVIQRLSGNMDVYSKSVREASESYAEGTELANVYADTQDNLNAKLQRLANAFDAFQAAASGPFAAALAGILEPVIGLIEGFTKLAESPVGSFLLGMTTLLAAGTAAFAGMNFVLNIATAQILAMRTAMAKMGQMQGMNILGASGFITTLKSLISQINGTTFAVTMKTGALEFLNKEQMEAAVLAGTLTKENQQLALSNAQAATATRGLSVALRLIPWVSLASLVALVGTAVLDMNGAFDQSAKKAEEEAKRLEELGKAGINAAGGLNAFTDAMEKDSESSRIKSLGDLEDAQDKVNTALQTGIDLYGDYEDALPEGEDTDNEIAEQKGKEYRDVLARTLGEPVEGDTASFVEKFLELDSETEGVLTKLGFDYVDMVDQAIADADGEGARTYIAAFEEAFRLLEDGDIAGSLGVSTAETIGQSLIAQFGSEIGEPLAERIRALVPYLANEDIGIDELSSLIGDVDFSNFKSGAEFIDATNNEVTEQIKVQNNLDDSLGSSEESQKSLNDQIKEYLKDANSELIANQNLASSFTKLADGMIETNGSMTGLDDASIQNRKNFEDFITKSFELADALGEDASFAIQKATGYAAVLAEEGVDVTDMIDQIAAVASAQLPGVAADFGVVVDALSQGIDEEAITSFVRAAFALRVAAAQTKAEYFELQAQIRNTISFIEGINVDFGIGELGKSVKDTTSALEKMERQIEETFGFFDRLFNANDALRTLATGLEENGKTFDAWSQTGQENTQNIIDVIDALANKSGGDTQRFANSLMSLRTVLANMGVGERGLRFVDSALEQLGVTGVASTNEMKNLNEVLSQTGDSADEIKTVAEAVEAISSAAKSGLEARFAEARAIDDITLALIDYEEAQEDAADAVEGFQEDIADAKEEIDDAKQAIVEANAAIGELTADRGKLEYQLEVALRYGDLLRADQIRADIANIDAEIASEQDNISDSNKDISDAQKEIADAEQGIVDVRTRSTRETIEATRALEDLAGMYVDTTAHMLANAGEGADLNGIINDQVEAFRNNAIQMGATETEADKLANILREELIASMDEIPENIETEIKAETAQALSDIDYFVNQANDRLGDVEREIVTTHKVVSDNSGLNNSGNFKGYNVGFYGGGGDVEGYRDGGFVSGAGGPREDRVPAMLSDGEYVIQANAVDKYGIPFLNALNQSMVRANPLMSGGAAGSMGSGVMQLSPEDRALLRAAIDRPINLYTDNATIAKSANSGNTLLAQRGLN